MMAIRDAGRKRMVVGAALALIAGLAVMARGCGNPGAGTVHLDPKVRAKLGRFQGLRPADYGKKKVEPIGIKSRPRKAPAPK
jgi:hypothetical protein